MRLGIEVGLNAVAAAAVDDLGVPLALESAEGTDALGGALTALGQEVRESVTRVVIALTPEVPAGKLERTAVLRLSGPSHPALAPLATWPKHLSEQIGPYVETIRGGATLGGRSISEPDLNRIAKLAQDASEAGVRGIAVCGAGSPTRLDLEESCAETIRSVAPGLSITLSHTLGGTGLRNRENAAVLNAALRPWAARFAGMLEETLLVHGIAGPVYVARTAGGAVGLEKFRQFPFVCTDGASGCLFLGAAHLARIPDAVVVDAGHGGIRSVIVEAGRLPVRPDSSYASAVRTSVAEIAYERVAWKDFEPEKLPAVDAGKVNLVAALALGGFEAQVIVVGSRAMDLDPDLVPRDAKFAAAIGAAISPVRADLERVVRVDGSGTVAEALAVAREDTVNQAVEAGADRTTIIVDRLEHAPMSYLPPGFHLVVASASGQAKPMTAPR